MQEAPFQFGDIVMYVKARAVVIHPSEKMSKVFWQHLEHTSWVSNDSLVLESNAGS